MLYADLKTLVTEGRYEEARKVVREAIKADPEVLANAIILVELAKYVVDELGIKSIQVVE